MSTTAKSCRRRVQDERGAALVEFAIVLPILAMLLLGLVSIGSAWSQRLSLDHSAREAARYGVALPDNQFGTGAGSQWATNVASEVRQRANGDLDVTGATVCVALVTGTPATVYTAPSGGTSFWYSSTYPYASTTGSTQPCFDDGGADGNRRVQVRVTRPGSIEAFIFTKTITLSGQATARFEFD